MEPFDHFPGSFDFFDLGRVRDSGTARKLGTPEHLITFTLSGEEPGTCLVWFEGALEDQSMAVEMANILASKFVSSLCDDAGLLVDMSPPRFVDREEKAHHRLSSLALRSVEGAKRGRTYVYEGMGERIRIHLIYIESQRGTA